MNATLVWPCIQRSVLAADNVWLSRGQKLHSCQSIVVSRCADRVRWLSPAVQHCLEVQAHRTFILKPPEVPVRCLMSVPVVRTRRERCVLAADWQCQAAKSQCLVPRQVAKHDLHSTGADKGVTVTCSGGSELRVRYGGREASSCAGQGRRSNMGAAGRADPLLHPAEPVLARVPGVGLPGSQPASFHSQPAKHTHTIMHSDSITLLRALNVAS